MRQCRIKSRKETRSFPTRNPFTLYSFLFYWLSERYRFLESFAGMFYKCSSLTSLDLSSFNTANVTDMGGVFINCSSLTSLNLTNFNTAKVTSMSGMFSRCSSLASLNLTSFNTEKVTDMNAMFNKCSSLPSLDLTNFNTENVTDMGNMFFGSRSLTTIYCNDDWSVGGKVKDHGQMFSYCPKLKGEGAAYDSSKTGIEMANPTTGYFTAKTTVLTM